MNTFGLWLRWRAPILLSALLLAAVFAVVIYLYRAPMETALYGAAICAVMTAGLGAADFVRARHRHETLMLAVKNPEAMPESLPEPEGFIEADYTAAVKALRQENAALRASYTMAREEADDYYVLWTHQIKTPISAMHLVLQSGELGEAERRELTAELFSVEQYVELAMNYQRLSGDGSDLVIAECPLDEVVRRAVRKYARQFIRRGLSLDFVPTEYTVLTDDKWLQFVIEQVLTNALKYTREGGISIYMASPGVLTVADTGIGIAPEDLPRIFQRGFTGYNGRGDKKSTGIGLYLCRRVMGMLGHTISAESQPGNGTKILLGLRHDERAAE